MKETYGETTEEDHLAKRVLNMFGDEWAEKFTREWLARELRQSSTSKSTRKSIGTLLPSFRVCDLRDRPQPDNNRLLRRLQRHVQANQIRGRVHLQSMHVILKL